MALARQTRLSLRCSTRGCSCEQRCEEGRGCVGAARESMPPPPRTCTHTQAPYLDVPAVFSRAPGAASFAAPSRRSPGFAVSAARIHAAVAKARADQAAAAAYVQGAVAAFEVRDQM